MLSLAASGISGELFFDPKIESSDMVVKDGKVYIVDDEGGLLVRDGNNSTTIRTGISGLDLEGITSKPNEPNIVYLGQEYPAKILKYDVTQKKVLKEYTLKGFPNDGGAGMESLVYVPEIDAFLAGSQANSRVYIYRITNDNPTLLGDFQPPGADSDLSGMTVYENKIYFLYDSPQLIVVSDYSLKGDSLVLCNTKTYGIDIPDAEGIALDADYVYVCKDSGPVNRISRKEFTVLEEQRPKDDHCYNDDHQ
jgi:hypothetical protein